MLNDNVAKPLTLSGVSQDSQPEEVIDESIEVNEEVLVQESEGENKEEDLVFNRQKELERRINEVKKSQEEVKKLERELRELKKDSQPKFSEDDFLGTLARKHEILDDNGDPDIKVTKKLIGLMGDFLQNTIEPRLSEFEKNNVLKSFDDYDIYRDQIENIMDNDLADVNCSRDKKVKIAYEMAKSRNPIKGQEQSSIIKPNMMKASVNTKSSKSILSATEIAILTKQAEESGLDPKSVIKRAEKLRQGYRGI